MQTGLRPNSNAKFRLIALGLPGLVVMCVAWVRFGTGAMLHQDEPAWVASAYYFELFAAGEWSHPDWRLLPARESPFVGKALFGAALRVADCPVRSFDQLGGWHEAWFLADERARGAGQARVERDAVSARLNPYARAAIQRRQFRFVEPQQLAATRRLVAFFGVVCAVAVAALGRWCRSPATGLVAGVGLALHGLAVESYTHALFDTIALAFSSLAVLALIGLIGPWRGGSDRQRSHVWNCLAVGILIALAVGTKMNALITVLVTFELILILGVGWLSSRDRHMLTGALSLGGSLIVAFALFIAINPAMYGDVFNGLRDLFAIQTRTVQVQAAFLPDHLDTFGQKFRAVGTLVCGHPAGLLVLVLATLWPTWEGLRRFSPRTVVVLWWWTALAAVTVWIPFPWPRYVLPVLAPAVILCADACVGGCTAILTRLAGKRGAIAANATD